MPVTEEELRWAQAGGHQGDDVGKSWLILNCAVDELKKELKQAKSMCVRSHFCGLFHD